MKAADQLIALERKAQEQGHAVEEIGGHRVCCRVRYQRRRGVRVAAAYFELNGKRAKHAEVAAAVGAI